MNEMLSSDMITGAPKEEGFVVGAFRGSNGIAATIAQEKELRRFSDDFKTVFTEAVTEAKDHHVGMLLKYSYFDTDKRFWGGIVDTDRAPWDALSTASTTYSQFGNEEVRTINIGLREGLVNNIPSEVHYISFGPGESSVFRLKDLKLITTLTASRHRILGTTITDINKRYALENAQSLYDNYGLDSTALQADFFTREFFTEFKQHAQLTPGVTPLVAIFGGTAQNIANTPGVSSREGLVTFFSKMRKSLPNVHLVMTVDATPDDADEEEVTKPYQYSLENEIFVLNFMARAVQQGIIKDPNYDIFGNWRVLPNPVWTGEAVNNYIVAQADHILETTVGDFNIKAGQRVSVSTSRKGPIQSHLDILNDAGMHIVGYYPQGRNDDGQTSKYIIHASDSGVPHLIR